MRINAYQVWQSASCEMREAIDVFCRKEKTMRVGEGTFASLDCDGVLVKVAIVKTRKKRVKK